MFHAFENISNPYPREIMFSRSNVVHLFAFVPGSLNYNFVSPRLCLSKETSYDEEQSILNDVHWEKVGKAFHG